jgi:hypothetical protein
VENARCWNTGLVWFGQLQTMWNDTPAVLQSAATDGVEQRAQWEAFELSVPDPGTVRVRNHSYADPDEHTYDVEVRHGSAVSCECPGDEYHDRPCNHRVAVEDQPAVVGAATDEVAQAVRARTDGGVVEANGAEIIATPETDGPVWEGPLPERDTRGRPTGAAYVRCRDCGVEVLSGNKEIAAHREGCSRANVGEN